LAVRCCLPVEVDIADKEIALVICDYNFRHAANSLRSERDSCRFDVEINLADHLQGQVGFHRDQAGEQGTRSADEHKVKTPIVRAVEDRL
jgi:hypothetical protein